jgi:hypothetical protein
MAAKAMVMALVEAGSVIRSFYGKAYHLYPSPHYLIWNKSKERLTCAKFST